MARVVPVKDVYMYLKKGFSLIELMVVVVIISVLVALAYPSYMGSIRQSRRAEAQAALFGLAQALERYYTTEGTYTSAAVGSENTGVPTIFSSKTPVDGPDTYYHLKIHSASGSAYVIAAEPVGAQAGDGILILKSTGTRGWDVDNDAAGVVAGLGISPNEVESTEMHW